MTWDNEAHPDENKVRQFIMMKKRTFNRARSCSFENPITLCRMEERRLQRAKSPDWLRECVGLC